MIRAVLDAAVEWSRAQQALRALVVVAPLAALACAAVDGFAPPGWYVALVAVLALTAAWSPESSAALVASALVLAWWCRLPDDGLGPMVLPATGALLVGHLAAMLAASGPPEALVSGALVRRWCLRGGLLLVAMVPIWLVARTLRSAAPGSLPDDAWVWGLVSAALLLVAGSLALAGRGSEEEA